MGYAHISNMYKEQTILLMRECWAMEKIHGTSTEIAYQDGAVSFSSGGVKPARFEQMVNRPDLKDAFVKMGHQAVTVYGEAYGGSFMKQSFRYGPDLRFIAFDVQVVNPEGRSFWLSVPDAHDVCRQLGFEFVHYERISTDLDAIDAARDAPSEQARRNGVEGDQPREGVVLRPIIELVDNNGERVCAKHKRDAERETNTPRRVDDPAKLTVLADAQAIADEWVTETRLQHVLDKMPTALNTSATLDVMRAMTEDIFREGAGEVVDSREARNAIGRATAKLFKAWVETRLRGEDQA